MSKAIPEHPLEWMPKEVWGPIKWSELHARALSCLPMNDEDKWFDEFIRSIPCNHCQTHFKLYIDTNSPDFSSRINFYKWTVGAHNYVNKSTGKKELTFEESILANIKAIQ